MDHKPLFRISSEESSHVRHGRPNRKAAETLLSVRERLPAPNQVWPMDFLSGQFIYRREYRIMTMVDAHSNFSPTIDARLRYTGEDVVAIITRDVGIYDNPRDVRLDDIPEIIFGNLILWPSEIRSVLDFSCPGTPNDNSLRKTFC